MVIAIILCTVFLCTGLVAAIQDGWLSKIPFASVATLLIALIVCYA